MTDARKSAEERQWTDEHYVTRNSIANADEYRCWMSCRCGWVGDDLPDGNIPTTHHAELEHYREAWQAARPVQVTDEMVERAAKALAGVPQEADWPDRWPSDDEYRDIMRDQARAALEAALGQTNEGEN